MFKCDEGWLLTRQPESLAGPRVVTDLVHWMQLLQMKCLLSCICLRKVQQGDRGFGELCPLEPNEKPSNA